MQDHKRETVKAFNALDFRVFAAGDSYNDIGMLKESELGILFNAPQKVIDNFPDLPLRKNYHELVEIFEQQRNI